MLATSWADGDGETIPFAGRRPACASGGLAMPAAAVARPGPEPEARLPSTAARSTGWPSPRARLLEDGGGVLDPGLARLVAAALDDRAG